MAKRVGEHGNPFMGCVFGRSLELRACADSPLYGDVQIVRNNVGMNGRPMPAIALQIATRADSTRC